jgi:hypothetical protein
MTAFKPKTFEDIWEKYPVSENNINDLNKLRDFWHANSHLTGEKTIVGNGYTMPTRVWNDESLEQEFIRMYDNFLGDLLDTHSPEEVMSTLGVSANPLKGYFLCQSTNLSQLKNWNRAVELWTSLNKKWAE